MKDASIEQISFRSRTIDNGVYGIIYEKQDIFVLFFNRYHPIQGSKAPKTQGVKARGRISNRNTELEKERVMLRTEYSD